jgi:hypothetical protein
VRVVADPWFANQRDGATEGFVAGSDEPGVFFPWHHVIGIAEDVEERDAMAGEWG